MEIFDIIEETETEEQKALKNNQNEPNPNVPGEDETLQLTTDLPVMNFMPEEPIMIEQKIDVIMVVVLNDPKIEKTIQVINTAVKNRKVTGVVYGVSDITNVDEFKSALEAQKQAQLDNTSQPPEEDSFNIPQFQNSDLESTPESE